MWNERYAEQEYAYGKEPNAFFKSEIDKIESKGKALFVAEGEGRNAVYAALQGWEVVAFDKSIEGKHKAVKLAKSNNVELDYRVGDFDEVISLNERFDLVVFVFAHIPQPQRGSIHTNIVELLNPGGKVILEAFSKEHLKYKAQNPKVGGPGIIELLLSEDELRAEFKKLKNKTILKTEVTLSEGKYHQGVGHVVRVLGDK